MHRFRTNLNILEELNITNELLGKVASLTVEYVGHVARGSGSPLAQIIEGKVEEKIKRGRQRKQWYDNTKEWT